MAVSTPLRLSRSRPWAQRKAYGGAQSCHEGPPPYPVSSSTTTSASREAIRGLKTTTDNPDASDASLLPSDLQRGRPSPENKVDRKTCLTWV